MSDEDTLKDLDNIKIEHDVRQAHLKDGKGNDMSNYCISCVERTIEEVQKHLRQEVIKHIESLYGPPESQAGINWMCWFFNIPEKEYKEVKLRAKKTEAYNSAFFDKWCRENHCGIYGEQIQWREENG